METTEEVMHQQFGIPFIFIKRPEWDKFPGAVDTYAADTLMPDGKVIQQPSTHLLGQKFAKVFNVKFKDKDEKEKLVWQTCYGPAISRIIASVFAFHGDDQGLIFPFNIAPLQVIIVPILGKDSQKVLKKAQELKNKLVETEIRAEVDDSDKRPGDKYYFWEMKGVPIRIELGLKEIEQGKLTIFRRDIKKKVQINENEMLKMIRGIGEDIVKTLRERADKSFEGKIQEAKTMDELKEKLKKGGFVKVPFCSVEMDGKECADNLKFGSGGADIRGTTPFKEEKAKGTCIWCKKPAKVVVYVGKSY
jgi:prolyl-tRNA synthetase